MKSDQTLQNFPEMNKSWYCLYAEVISDYYFQKSKNKL